MTLEGISETKEFITNMRKLSESIWSDIQDRSSGEVTRKEDSVNLLDKHQFIDYVKNHYESLYPEEHKITSTSIDLGVPVIYESGYSERVSYYFKQNSIVISHYRTPKSLVKALNDNFLLEDVDTWIILMNLKGVLERKLMNPSGPTYKTEVLEIL